MARLKPYSSTGWFAACIIFGSQSFQTPWEKENLKPKWGTSHNQMLGCLVRQEVEGDKSQRGMCWGVTPCAHVIAINDLLCKCKWVNENHKAVNKEGVGVCGAARWFSKAVG